MDALGDGAAYRLEEHFTHLRQTTAQDDPLRGQGHDHVGNTDAEIGTGALEDLLCHAVALARSWYE